MAEKGIIQSVNRQAGELGKQKQKLLQTKDIFRPLQSGSRDFRFELKHQSCPLLTCTEINKRQFHHKAD